MYCKTEAHVGQRAVRMLGPTGLVVGRILCLNNFLPSHTGRQITVEGITAVVIVCVLQPAAWSFECTGSKEELMMRSALDTAVSSATIHPLVVHNTWKNTLLLSVR
jgi:hypothetical protein